MSPPRPAGLIDVHAHVALPDALGRAGALGPTQGVGDDGTPWFQVGDYRLDGVRYDHTPFSDLTLRLEAMDRLGITHQVLSPNPIVLLANSEIAGAARYARWHNEALAELVAERPDRVSALSQVPVQDPSLAATELRRAVDTLGHVGLALGTEAPFDLDDGAMDPLWAEAESLGAPVFVHPAPHGIDKPSPDARLGRFGLDLSLGFLLEETLAVAQLILGGVLDRHPGLRVCVSHGGGATAWLAPRLRTSATRMGMTAADIDAGLARLWWDSHVGGGAPLRLLIDTVGTDHLVLGTNLAGWDSPSELTDEVPAELLDPLADNARALLGWT
ncbi:MAG: amidohydrolase family protein [Microthrixaceae bacterium]